MLLLATAFIISLISGPFKSRRLQNTPIPRRHPNTNEVIQGTAQIESLETHYNVPFTKEKAQELLDMYPEKLEPGPNNLMIVDSSVRRFSCNKEEFVEAGYEDLLNLKIGFAEYMADRERSRQKRK
jgi:hypothetical protein